MARNDGWNLKDWLKIAREEKFNVKSLARRLGVSERQFGRLTLEWFGNTAKALIDQERIGLMPMSLFKHGSVKSAADDLHLHESYFTRKFKEHYRTTPRQFLAWMHDELKRDRNRLTPEQTSIVACLLQNVAKSQINVAKGHTSAVSNSTELSHDG